MNSVSLLGRLARDPEIRTSQGGTKVARYTLAVNRQYKREGEPEADFINCIAFGTRADFVEKFLQKGRQIAIAGRIQTGSYEKDGVRHYTTDIVVDSHYFADSATRQAEAPAPAAPRPQKKTYQPKIEDFVPEEDDSDEGLPF